LIKFLQINLQEESIPSKIENQTSAILSEFSPTNLELIDTPTNRQVLGGFVCSLIFCYFIYSLFSGKEKKVIPTPIYEKPKYYKKK
jgi:hypothetical protein